MGDLLLHRTEDATMRGLPKSAHRRIYGIVEK